MKRVLSAVAATALLSIAPVTMTGTAHAEGGDVATTSVAQPAAERAPQQEAKRNVSLFLQERNNNNRFFATGKAKPNYKNSTVIIKRAIGENNNNYKVFKRVKTNGQGKYRTRVANPPRVGQVYKYFTLVKARGSYGAARSAVKGIQRLS